MTMTADVPAATTAAGEAPSAAQPLSSLAVRMQKKLAGKLASSKTLSKQVLTETASTTFDSLHALLRQCMEKEKADKLAKYAMKLALKVGVLAKNGLLDGPSEQQRLDRLRRHLHNLALCIVSFSQVQFSYECEYITGLCQTLRAELEPLVDFQLSDKSSARLAFLFDTLCTSTVMDEIFRPAHDQYLKRFANDLDGLMDHDQL